MLLPNGRMNKSLNILYLICNGVWVWYHSQFPALTSEVKEALRTCLTCFRILTLIRLRVSVGNKALRRFWYSHSHHGWLCTTAVGVLHNGTEPVGGAGLLSSPQPDLVFWFLLCFLFVTLNRSFLSQFEIVFWFFSFFSFTVPVKYLQSYPSSKTIEEAKCTFVNILFAIVTLRCFSVVALAFS